MRFIPGHVYHVYNRGNNKQRIFFSERNYRFFLQKIQHQLAPNCEILCWCLMPNHFHLVIYATEKGCHERSSFGGKPMQELSHQIGILLSSYSQAVNKQNGTTGSLFQQKTKAKCIFEPGHGHGQAAQSGPTVAGDYLLTCMHYIHQNPWKAKLADRMDDWEYSSFREYAGKETFMPCNYGLLLSLAGYEAGGYCDDSYVALNETEVDNIW